MVGPFIFSTLYLPWALEQVYVKIWRCLWRYRKYFCDGNCCCRLAANKYEDTGQLLTIFRVFDFRKSADSWSTNAQLVPLFLSFVLSFVMSFFPFIIILLSSLTSLFCPCSFICLLLPLISPFLYFFDTFFKAPLM